MSTSSRIHLTSGLRSISAALLLAIPTLAGQDNWPTWRGPEGTGVASSSAPTSWSDEENVRWRVPIPGRGFSTPVIWEGRIYLTTAIPLEKAQPPEGEGETDARDDRGGDDNRRRRRGFGGRGPQASSTVKSAFVVLCLDLASGEELWRKTAHEAKPHEGYHRNYGSHASISPVTDGQRLICSFGSQGIYCFDLEGELMWEHELKTPMQMRHQFGEGANPALHSGLYVHVFDHEADSFMFVLDAETGELKWRKQRDEPSSWSTPLVTEYDGGWQVVTSASNRMRSYELSSGDLIWECGGIGLNAIPSVLRHKDLVIAMSGYREANLQAVRLGGKGDITEADPSPIAWSSSRGTAYTASPVLHDGRYYAVQDGGKISCFDATSGEPHYLEERLPRGAQLKASPVAAGSVLYVATEEGDVHMVSLGDEFELLGTNTLSDQFFVSSPVVVGGQLLLRSRSDLFCIAEDE